MQQQLREIAEFQAKFKQAYRGSPRILDPELCLFRVRFMIEEILEFATANNSHDLSRALDALVDLLYVLLGTVHLTGLSPVFLEAWNLVHEANMKKELAGDPARSKRGFRNDIIKPEGWTAPDLSGLVS